MLFSNSKTSKTQPYIVTALVVLTASFFLIQLVADKILTRKESENASREMSLLSPPSSPSKSLIGTDLLNLNDEFFSSPFMFDSSLMAMKKEMDRQRDLLLGSMSEPRRGGLRLGDKMFEPPYRLKEDDDRITVTVSVPDIPLSDIDIEILDGRVMHISGTKKVEKGGSVSVTSFDKRFALGKNLDQDRISAKLKKGELTVETPKQKLIEGDKKVRKITIEEL